MNRIFISLIFILIALTSIACVSASSDFNETVNQDYIISDVNETAVTIDENVVSDDEIAEDPDSAVIPVNDTSEIMEDDTENQDSTEIPFNNSINKKDLKPVTITAGNQSEVKKTCYVLYFKIPDVDVNPTRISTGNKIDDAAVYYSAYYKAFKNLPKERAIDLLDWTIGLVYQSYNEKDTIDIVAKIYSMVELDGLDPFLKPVFESIYHSAIEKRFKDTYKYPWEFKEIPTIDNDNPFVPYNPIGPDNPFGPEENPKA